MAPKACDVCQRVTSKLTQCTQGGQPAALCKKCYEQAAPDPDPAAAPPEPALQGRVLGAAGGVEGVRVGVKGLEKFTLSDDTGGFQLDGVLADLLAQAATELFELLCNRDPSGGCEAWLRSAAEAGDLPEAAAAMLRSADIGAAVNEEAFVSMVTKAAGRMTPRVLSAAGRDSGLVLSLSKAGFAPCSLPLGKAEQLARGVPLEVTLQQVQASGKVDPASGGKVVDEASGASVTLAPGTQLVKADGTPYEGEVNVSLSVIDATDEGSLEAMPGDFSASCVDGAAGQLESFGAMWVGLADDGGSELQLAKGSQGMELDFRSAAAVNGERTGAWPTLWEFDEATGKWRQDANAQLAVDGVVLPQAGQDPANVPVQRLDGSSVQAEEVPMEFIKGKKKGYKRNSYEDVAAMWTPEQYAKMFGKPSPKELKMTNIPRAGYWNCDAPYITTFLRGRVLDEEGNPVAKANVWSAGIDYMGSSPKSSANGEEGFSVLAQQGCSVNLHVLLPGAPGPDPKKPGPPERFRFGPFETGPPGESKDVGALRLSKEARYTPPPPKSRPNA